MKGTAKNPYVKQSCIKQLAEKIVKVVQAAVESSCTFKGPKGKQSLTAEHLACLQPCSLSYLLLGTVPTKDFSHLHLQNALTSSQLSS